MNNTKQTDIFHWTNKMVEDKEDLDVELFLINKNYIPYRISVSSELNAKIQPIFIDELIEFVLGGAETGLQVRDLEDTDGDRSILGRVDLDRVYNADSVLKWIDKNENIEQFNEYDHDLKRMRGIVARFTHPEKKRTRFHVIKMLQKESVLKKTTDWQIKGDTFSTLYADAATKIPVDNQILVINNDLFAFNPSKLAKMFNFDVRSVRAADRVGAMIDKEYRLSMPTIDQGISFMATQRPSLIKKMLKVEPGLIKQDQVIETIDEMGLKLMTDDNGAIILMDLKDVGIFLDILLDNFMKSEATGNEYLVKSKKQLVEIEE